MISVLVTILKIIGIILLAVLGIFVFLVCLVLFVPIRYQIAGRVGADMSVTGKIGWFLSAFCCRFSFAEQEFDGQVEVFGIRLQKKQAVFKEEPEEDMSVPNDVFSDRETTVSAETAQTDTEKTVRPGTGENVKNDMPQNPLKKLSGRIKQLYVRLKDSLYHGRQFFAKIKDMLTNAENRYAVKKLWAELCYLLKHFGFRSIYTDLTFSLADPALTGQALGLLCMIPFLYQYDFHIYPDFESEQYLIEGTYEVKGSIRLIYLCIAAVRLLKDAAIRNFIKKLL